MSDPVRIAVIGGGVSGLATAVGVLDGAAARGLDVRVEVLEKAPRSGGNLRTIEDGEWRLEWGPNGFLDNEPATLRLVDRLGLRDALRRSSDLTRHRFILKGGRLREIPMTPPAFIRSDLFSVGAKLRLLGDLFLPPRRDLGRADVDPSTDESVFDFGKRRLGAEFAETMLDPMVKGIFGGDARQLSLAAAFPRMVEMERDHGSLFKAMIAISKRKKKLANAGGSGVLHSFDGGMVRLVDALVQVLEDDPRAALRCGVAPGAIRRDADGWLVGEERFDHVVQAAPAHAAAEQLRGFDPILAALMTEIPYVAMAVIALGFRREDVAHDLAGFGFLVPTYESRRLLGALWTSSIFTDRAPEGRVLVRCMAGGPGDPRVLDLTDPELVDTAVGELRGLLGLRGDPERSWVIRHPRAIAQYVPGHPDRLRRMEERVAQHAGLHLTGSSYRGVSVNTCLKDAERTAAAVLDAARKG
jgi:oxygen-dependent protoporphyrinogen oxidase